MTNDLISRSALLEELSKGTIITDDLYGMGIMAGNDHAMKKIKAAPAVDAVEVCRCKECKHMMVDFHKHRWCKAWERIQTMGDEGYCCFGERRADDDH